MKKLTFSCFNRAVAISAIKHLTAALKPRHLALAAIIAAFPTLALATPSSGVATTIISKCGFDDLDISAKRDIDPGVATHFWKARIDTKGATDLYVVSNTFAPGATSGWHTHPGPSLITVTAGTITAYDSSCTAHVYPAGTCFVDEGGEHAHLLRNEGSIDAVTVAVQLIPAGFPRRIDAPAPANCPVF